MKLTHEDIVEKVEIWLNANKGRAADGFYLTDDKKYVADAYGPMGPGRYMPVEDFYEIHICPSPELETKLTEAREQFENELTAEKEYNRLAKVHNHIVSNSWGSTAGMRIVGEKYVEDLMGKTGLGRYIPIDKFIEHFNL